MNAVSSKQHGSLSVPLAIILVIVLAAGAYFYQQYRTRLADLEQNLNTVREELIETRSRARAAELEQSRLSSARDRSTQRLEALQAQYDQLRLDAQSNVGDLQGEVETARQERATFEQRLAEQRQLQEVTEAELIAARNDNEKLASQLAASQQHVQRLLNERTALLATTSRMERENSELQERLDTAISEVNAAEEELARRESVVDEYRQAREQLALQQARNENYTETIAELEARLDRETDAMDELQSQLQSLSNERQTLVSRLEDGTTVIKLPENIVFASGSADIGEAGAATLQLLADALESFPEHLISIQGHTDSRSISSDLQRLYPSNWELSTARAASAVRVLNQAGISDARMQAVGFADTRPLVEETDAQSRRANRRIEVLLYPTQFTMRVLDQESLETP